jgi:hypothetical protein
MATLSYRERMKAARAEASAQRKAQHEAYRRQLELRVTTERLARQLVIAGIRARGDKVSDYLAKDITAMAHALICPALVEQARWRLEARGVHKTQNI